MPYEPLLKPESRFVQARGLMHHLWAWGPMSAGWPMEASGAPALVLLHGWMDVGASFQFMVDALSQGPGRLDQPLDQPLDRPILALDLRGFGDTLHPPTDAFWYADYLGDLDAVLDLISPSQPIDLLGHSMGGNVAMMYAGIRPSRIRKLINLEGFGMPASRPQQAPSRYARWLDQLKSPASLQAYPSAQAVANRLQKNNPRLTRDRAEWLATHWAREGEDGQWHLKADPAHKHISPLLYQKDEALACWSRITAPMLWVEGEQTHIFGNGHEGNPWWGDAYPRSEFEARLSVVAQVERCLLPNAGHMLHHDQPEALAEAILSFLNA